MADSTALGASPLAKFRLQTLPAMDKVTPGAELNCVVASMSSATCSDGSAGVVLAEAECTSHGEARGGGGLYATATQSQKTRADPNSTDEDDQDEAEDEEDEECRSVQQTHANDHQRTVLGRHPTSSDDKKRRRSDRCDSSESSDSGVTSLTCSDALSWSSSSDLTEPVSPVSPASLTSSQPCPSREASPSTVAAAQDQQRPDQQQGDGQQQSSQKMEEEPASFKKRRRRHSDSMARQGTTALVGRNGVQRKRARRLSGSCPHSLKALASSSVTDSETWEAAGPQWSAYTCMWRNHTKALQLDLCSELETEEPYGETFQPSWTMNRSDLKKTGQLKITEFFSTQVKQLWSYQSKLLKNRRSDYDDCAGGGRSPSRVAIVSVAHVEPHSAVDATQLENRETVVETPDDSQRPTEPAQPPPSQPSPTKEAPVVAHTQPVPQIRFPVDQTPSIGGKSGINEPSFDVVQCLWEECGISVNLSLGQSLLEHIHSVHVAAQAGDPPPLAPSSSSVSSSCTSSSSSSSSASSTCSNGSNTVSNGERFVCEWEGCKVQGRTSSSRAWLERHVLTHVGSKPFRCIVESCDQRFSSQATLQRHVNAHFNQEGGQSNSANCVKRDNSGHVPAKVLRRNSKKFKNRRKAAPARLFDYFDMGIMERLRHQLLGSQKHQMHLGLSPLTNHIIVKSQIIARRLDASGKTRVLVRWSPHEILPDQWLLESEVVPHKSVPLQELSTAAQIRVQHMLNPTTPPPTASTRKNRRK